MDFSLELGTEVLRRPVICGMGLKHAHSLMIRRRVGTFHRCHARCGSPRANRHTCENRATNRGRAFLRRLRKAPPHGTRATLSTKEKEAEESFLGLSCTTDAQQALWPLIQMQLPAAPDVDTWLCAVAAPCGAATDDVVAKWMTSPAAIASTTSVTAARARNTALGESWAVRS